MKRKDFMLVIRNVNPATYAELKKMAVEDKISVARAFNEAVAAYKEKQSKRRRPDPRNFRKVIGIIKTDGPVRWSEEVDELLYGWKK